jgi:putative endonuclease
MGHARATRAKKQAAWRFGRRAEALAILWLRLKGYRILDRNLRHPVGEIDIVAQRGDTLVFIEVKARPGQLDAAAAITPYQRERIIRAARAYLGKHPHLAEMNLRFDALLLSPWRWPVHIRNAWQTEGGKW